MSDTPFRGFASDNNSGVHPDILRAIERANRDHAVAYGDDPWTRAAVEKFQEVFGAGVRVAFVFNGTGANVTALAAIARAYECVIATDCAHINTDECGAPESAGLKLLAIPHRDGKITVADVEKRIRGVGDVHHVQPRILSLTQSTELGTLYRPEEMKALADCAHAHGMWVHLDGARLANAAAALGLSLRAVSGDLGIDVMSFGGTKNGLMLGEAVVFFREELARDYPYYRKQGMQLSSKMRFVSAQFQALLTDELWRRNASQANRMAQRLAEAVGRVTGVRISRPVEANAVFAILPTACARRLQARSFFYTWEETGSDSEVRWMASFDTTESDVDTFVGWLREAVG